MVFCCYSFCFLVIVMIVFDFTLILLVYEKTDLRGKYVKKKKRKNLSWHCDFFRPLTML